ncbi:phosphate ABC transporter ATP-binding protein [Sulfoacidibacillus thermotolerans]|uniref:Phosphate ABC transporter ATP-binding protein n=2 Tax=Sulfoacidibacillus thermotolerans TaxID=1765684 RepID=A0A2U3D6X5_SULT2|nr:phosphate ABC transporter ATP-binding protein [Sulfoacidibacillus thermotolerans]
MVEHSESAALAFRDVVKSFYVKDTFIPILKGVTAAVAPGDIVALIGPSGSGKSTLLSLCNLLITADAGKVFVDGINVLDWNITELRRKVGLVFQTPTIFPGTVRTNIELARVLQGDTFNQPERYLQNVGLSADLLDHEASELSGGQKQRVALARVLATEPKVLLLDEVTSALDPSAARDVEEWILHIHEKNKTTMLWVTHNLEQALRVSHWVWLMIGGQLIEVTETRQFFTSPQTELGRLFLQGELNGQRI